MEEVVEVDDKDRFIRWVLRSEVHEKRLIHRSVHAFVRNSKGQILIQLRHREKDTYPLHWDVSCSGHVEKVDHPEQDPDRAREASDSAIRRELEEELGVTSNAEYICDIPPIPDVNYEYARLYIAHWEDEFVLQETEVERVAWVNLDQLHSYQPRTDSLHWFAENAAPWNK